MMHRGFGLWCWSLALWLTTGCGSPGGEGWQRNLHKLGGLCDPSNPLHNCPSSFCDPTADGTQGLEQVSGFGDNLGNLRMFRYVPAGLGAGAPLVVALHGCDQNAGEYARLTGWNQMADRFGFALLYPEQKCENNAMCCFNWAGEFSDPDNMYRGHGENHTFMEMVDAMLVDHDLDADRVYITGASSGGAQTSLMLATWPDRFAAGAPMAGIPYYCTDQCEEVNNPCMNPGRDLTPQQWAEKVRWAYPEYQGPYPRISIWQGSIDSTVSNSNLTEIMEQWTELHGIDQVPDVTDSVKGHTHESHTDARGQAVVETYLIQGGQHAIPVDPGSGEDQCGRLGSWAYDRDICSTYYIASFFGLLSEPSEVEVGITHPPAGSRVEGEVLITAEAQADAGVHEVRFYVQDVHRCTDGLPPYQCLWDASALANGRYRLRVEAEDVEGRVAQHQIQVRVGAVSGFLETFSSAGPDHQEWNPGGWGPDAERDHTGGGSQSLAGAVEPSWMDMVYVRDTSVRLELGDQPTIIYQRQLDLSCAQYMCGSWSPVRFAVAVSGEGADATEQVVDQQVVDSGGSSYREESWTERTLDLSAWAGQTVTLRFLVEASYGSAARAWIDDVLVTAETDTMPPQVEIIRPSGGETLQGTVVLEAVAEDDQVVERVQFDLDGQTVGEVVSAPYQLEWNTQSVANGDHQLLARAFDRAGNQGVSQILPVVVFNDNSQDTQPPQVDVVSPVDGQAVGGRVPIRVEAQDDTGVSGVEFFVDGQWLGNSTGEPYQLEWNTAGWAPGAHQLSARAFDAAGNAGVDDDTTVWLEGSADCSQHHQPVPEPGASAFAQRISGSFSGLNMYLYVPEGVCAEPDRPVPLVVALHGCMQDAQGYAHDTDWTGLADQHKFLVIFAEHTGEYFQCFDWYTPMSQDGNGHARGVLDMIRYVQEHYNVDPGGVFATGVSAGAALAVILAAIFPEDIAGAGAMAGLPYAGYRCTGFWCAANSLQYIQNGHNKSPDEWAALMPTQPGVYPPLVVFHGTQDRYVHFMFEQELVEQWTASHGDDQLPEVDTTLKGYPYREYHHDGRAVVATVELTGMEHGIAVDPDGEGLDAGGQVCTTPGSTSCFSYDMDLYSSYWAARFWGIIPGGMPAE